LSLVDVLCTSSASCSTRSRVAWAAPATDLQGQHVITGEQSEHCTDLTLSLQPIEDSGHQHGCGSPNCTGTSYLAAAMAAILRHALSTKALWATCKMYPCHPVPPTHLTSGSVASSLRILTPGSRRGKNTVASAGLFTSLALQLE
jgi:hypothetical protein